MSDLYFEGGNILVGDDFWLLGADHLAHNRRHGTRDPRGGRRRTTAAARRRRT
jgi:hypothetical protein